MVFDPFSFFAGVLVSLLLIAGLVKWKGREILENAMYEEMMGMSDDIDEEELGLDEVEIND